MQLDHNGRQRDAKFNLSDFLYANEGKVGNLFIDEFPMEAHEINDGDYTKAIEWAENTNKDYFIEVMRDIYLDKIVG